MPKTTARDYLYICLFLALILFVWAGLMLLPGPGSVLLSEDAQGEYDLSAADLDNTVYLPAAVWESWPEKLYAPAALPRAEAPVSQQSIDYTSVQYATYRLRFHLPAGEDYGVLLGSPDYAMRVYINGGAAGSVGTPAASREGTVPQERGAVYYFTAAEDATEIVVQVANFVHAQGAGAPQLTLGKAANIQRLDTLAKLKTGLMFGCLLTAGLYHLAAFLLNRRQVAALLFGCACLLQAFASTNYALLLFPSVNWQIAVRLEYILFILALSTLPPLIDRLFPGALHRWLSPGYLALCGAYVVLVLATGTVFFTRLLIVFQALSVAMGVYLLVRLALLLAGKRTPKSVLAFLGVVAVALSGVNEALVATEVYLPGGMPGRYFGISEGMVFFVFCYALLLSIEQAEMNRRLEDARLAVAGAEERYQALLRRRESIRPPAAQLSDFALTRRETEVALLLLEGRSREAIAGLLVISMGTVNTHCTNIYRKAGVGGAAELAALVAPATNREKSE